MTIKEFRESCESINRYAPYCTYPIIVRFDPWDKSYVHWIAPEFHKERFEKIDEINGKYYGTYYVVVAAFSLDPEFDEEHEHYSSTHMMLSYLEKIDIEKYGDDTELYVMKGQSIDDDKKNLLQIKEVSLNDGYIEIVTKN